MRLKNVLVSTKQTDLEYARMRFDDVEKEFGKERYDQMILANKEHYASLKLIKENLESKGIPYQRIYMPYTAYEEFKDRDLVICVGGDGTVLNSVRYILDSTPVLTVKSESTSVGGLCVINSSQFEDTLNKVLNDNYRIELRTRAVANLDNMTDLTLNDVAIKPYFGGGFVRYEVNFKGIKEKLSGSGMVVSTGSGAAAWYQKRMTCQKIVISINFPREQLCLGKLLR